MLQQQRNQKIDHMFSPNVSEIDPSEKNKSSLVEEKDFFKSPENSPFRPVNSSGVDSTIL